MTEIIGFGELARLKRENQAKDEEIARLVAVIKETQVALRTAQGLNDLLRMQFNDLIATIDGWQASLGDVKVNILEMKHRLPD
jgi:hypothetical protein